MRTVVVMGQGKGSKAFFKQWNVEFTFNYQMIPHYPFRHVFMPDSVLHTLNIYGLQNITLYKFFMGEN